jgi:c-di-GMP-binding flagellar brake protein YcgR
MKPAAAHGASQEELLREAVARQSPIALSCRVADGWSGYYSKFLQESRNEKGLLIEYPWCDGAYLPELVPGQTLGVSFRRGPKRCVFSTILIATRRIALSGSEIPAILIEWPGQIFELQRRLDYRAPVPTDRVIEITTRKRPAAGNSTEPPMHATLMDVSAGGLSMAFPNDNHPRWDTDDVIECTFKPDPEQPPLEVIGRVRYAQQTRHAFRVGIQCYGLEATENGRLILDRMIDLCADYQQTEITRLSVNATCQ